MGSRFGSDQNGWGQMVSVVDVRRMREAEPDGRRHNKKPTQTDRETVLINRSHTPSGKHPLAGSRRGRPWYQRVSGCFVKDQAFSGPEQV
jgi:hypothetical protein